MKDSYNKDRARVLFKDVILTTDNLDAFLRDE
jgi:hypothetical protein